MKIIVLGCGFIGSVVAADLAQSLPSAEIVITDRSLSRSRETASATRRENVSGAQLDARNRLELVSALKKCDLVVGALPGDIGYHSVKAAIAAGVSMVDVSYMPENPLQLSKDAEKAGVTVVPDCGVAPGISNVLIGHSLSRLDKVESIYILVGGLPETPVPPLGYTITWSAEGLIDEYTREAKIVKDGRVVNVDALTGLEVVDFPGVGKLEAFYTDGLRTLIHTVKDAKTMWEKTLRYPGHVAKIQLLKALGFFDKEPLKVEDTSLAPRKLTSRLLEAKLRRPDIKDILALKVGVCGMRRNDEKHFIYYLLDHSEQKHRVSAMARTTAYPASVLAQLMAGGEIRAKGVVPLEMLSVEDKLFKRIMNELEKRQIKIVGQGLS
jgi:lysine 6-dehydrogenase